ncbi:hypothetical protein CKAN_01365800 [Cinnamomum micranthum f. kanehirae]|uniref:Uncharacterized protein n=1 Tax=Cinnamomum micranthum f. kanehirae TaxID=337451 RepID=A0A443P265_9MAGN|nr:hypothetical protein CKAN_01365800 [Cinnamomum micranthum f. kanehirae]
MDGLYSGILEFFPRRGSVRYSVDPEWVLVVRKGSSMWDRIRVKDSSESTWLFMLDSSFLSVSFEGTDFGKHDPILARSNVSSETILSSSFPPANDLALALLSLSILPGTTSSSRDRSSPTRCSSPQASLQQFFPSPISPSPLPFHFAQPWNPFSSARHGFLSNDDLSTATLPILGLKPNLWPAIVSSWPQHLEQGLKRRTLSCDPPSGKHAQIDDLSPSIIHPESTAARTK